MNNDNLVREMICTFHKIPKEDDISYFKEDSIREANETEVIILKKDKNDILMKVIWHKDDYSLIRDKDNKIDVWQVREDFNIESAIEFMKWWDKIYPVESNISPFELRFKGFEDLQKAARGLLAKGIKPKYVKNITGLSLEEIHKLIASA